MRVYLIWREGFPQTVRIARTEWQRRWAQFARGWVAARVCTLEVPDYVVETIGVLALARFYDEVARS